jgi:hypothetical protein
LIEIFGDHVSEVAVWNSDKKFDSIAFDQEYFVRNGTIVL